VRRPPIRRNRKGDFTVALSGDERDVLRQLPGQLRGLLGSDDPSLRRLFPTAYPEDDELEAEYRELMSNDLLESHTAALNLLEQTVDQERLTEAELVGWLGALNNLRLVLGTRLDVTEDMDVEPLDADDPRGPALALYHYLTWLQDAVVTALSGGL
jgi:hypothetical protein